MASQPEKSSATEKLSLHVLGVVCGLAAAVWLAAAEAPTKFVEAGLSPFLISFCMIGGVFVARWTLPTILKGTGYVFFDLREKPHLLIWAIIAGGLWAVGNTLTVFGVRDLGLSIAFPLWNTNSLVGVFWGWAFFCELRRAGPKTLGKVVLGAVAIVVGAVVLGYASSHEVVSASPHRALQGIAAALGAGLVFGTMYIPYRKAYISGMNPLSFVTIFTVGEVGMMGALAIAFSGGVRPLLEGLAHARPALFWLFLGGFCWVVGDLFQQYAAKYIGIGRGIPLSNTNQLWGLAWGILVFGELSGGSASTRSWVILGSLIMILGAAAISSAAAPSSEQASWKIAMTRECERYGLQVERVEASQRGEDLLARDVPVRRWWDIPIVVVAVGVFVWLATMAKRPPVAMDRHWTLVLIGITIVSLFACGWLLWKRTQFS